MGGGRKEGERRGRGTGGALSGKSDDSSVQSLTNNADCDQATPKEAETTPSSSGIEEQLSENFSKLKLDKSDEKT